MVLSSKKGIWVQYITSISLVFSIALICFLSGNVIDYKIVALILLVTVSSLAVIFDIFPVLISAVFSALILNYFFIEPIYNFHVKTSEDFLLLTMYLVVALVNAALTFKIRKVEKKAREKEEKENSIKLYNTLFNSLSHELKTPISTIIGAVDTLKDYSHKLSESNRNELLFQIDSAGMRLNNQVENLLNMSRLESGFLKLTLDWCDMNELIHQVMLKLSPESANHEIVFESKESLPFFRLDRGLIEQVIQNLLNNAILYTPEKSVISIDVRDVDEYCLIELADNGPGFPENEMDQIFGKFYRLPHSKAGGTGLGLSIVKGFVEAHGGTISLENKLTGGAKFSISIPCEKSYMNHLKNE